jgi:hypothetical protein
LLSDVAVCGPTVIGPLPPLKLVLLLADVAPELEADVDGPTCTPPLLADEPPLMLALVFCAVAPDWLLDAAASPATGPLVCCAKEIEGSDRAAMQAAVSRRRVFISKYPTKGKRWRAVDHQRDVSAARPEATAPRLSGVAGAEFPPLGSPPSSDRE